MAYDGMAAFVRALEARGELVRIKASVDPHLEVAHANGVGGIERVVRAAREQLGKERGA